MTSIVVIVAPAPVFAASDAVFGISTASNTVMQGNTFTVTYSVTPNNGVTLGRVSIVTTYQPGGYDLIGFDNSGSPFDSTLSESVYPGTDCLVLDRQSSSGVSSSAVVTRATFKAMKPSNYILNMLFFPGSPCDPHQGAWLMNGNSVRAIDDTASINLSIVAPGGGTGTGTQSISSPIGTYTGTFHPLESSSKNTTAGKNTNNVNVPAVKSRTGSQQKTNNSKSTDSNKSSSTATEGEANAALIKSKPYLLASNRSSALFWALSLCVLALGVVAAIFYRNKRLKG